MIEQNGSIRQSVVLDTQSQRIFRMRKGILTSSRLINARLDADKAVKWVPLMITLTYRPDEDWQPHHISDFLNRVQMFARRKGQKLPYAWVMELQKSGKPHYHCIVWIPRRWRLPRSDARGWWPHGSTNTVRANNPYGYLSKYASKAQGDGKHQFPHGARIHGIGGLTAGEAAIVAWWKLPKALRLGDEGSHKWRCQVGGGWLCIEGEAQGRFYASDWGLSAVDVVGKRVRLVEKPKIHHDEPVSFLYQAWRERIYDDGIKAAAAAYLSLEKYRCSWVWGGGALGYSHPTDVPSYLLSLPAVPQQTSRSEPLPF